jgi:hypothetical protein
MSKEALKLALSKIKSARDCHPNAVQELIFEAEELLEQALAAPVQEPVAILNHAHGVYAFRSVNLQGLPDGEYQIYTTPPAAPDLQAELDATNRQVEILSDALAESRAAVPDLLEALQAIVKSLSDQDDEGMIEHAQPMIDARAAIAKATGGAV